MAVAFWPNNSRKRPEYFASVPSRNYRLSRKPIITGRLNYTHNQESSALMATVVTSSASARCLQ